MTTKSLLHSSLLDNLYYNSMLVGNEPPATSDYQLLESKITTGHTTQIHINNIASTYAADYHSLELVISTRALNSSTNLTGLSLRFNDDATGSYNNFDAYANGSSVDGTGGQGNSYFIVGNINPMNNNPNENWGMFVMQIPDAFNTSKQRSMSYLAGGYTSTERNFDWGGAIWENTAAIEKITLLQANGYSLKAGTRISLYGWKG